MVFLLWVISFVVVWNVAPYVFLWSLSEVPFEHKVKASKSFFNSSLRGLAVLPFEILAPVVMLFVLPFIKREADTLPKMFWFWDNNVSINGDGWARKLEDGTWETVRVMGVENCIPYTNPDYTGDAYYAKGHHPRSFWARYIWLGWRNRASKFAESMGVPFDDNDRQQWYGRGQTQGPNRESGDRAVRGWALYRSGSHYQFYSVYQAFGSICCRTNWGFKVWATPNGDSKASVVNITVTLIRQLS